MVKIIKGIYGYRNKAGNIEPKSPSSPPFSLPREKEERLVSQGVAVFVEEGGPAASLHEEPGEVQEDTGYEETEEKALEDMTYEELKSLAKEKGIAYVGIKKERLIQELEEAAEKEAQEMPSFEAADPE